MHHDLRVFWYVIVLLSIIMLLSIGVPVVLGQSENSPPRQRPGRSLRAPAPSDLLEFEDPQRLSLSPDGRYVLIRTHRASVSEDKYVESRWILPTDTSRRRCELHLPSGARSVRWGSISQRIMYLAPTAGEMQVWSKEIGDESSQQVTRVDEGVESFRLSPSGNQLAYTVRRTKSVRRMNARAKGKENSLSSVEIDMRTFAARQLRGGLSTPSASSITELWIKDLASGTSRKISGALSVDAYRWSPSGDRLAIIALPAARKERQADGVPLYRSDLYIYERATSRIRTIHEGHQARTRLWDGTITFSNPFWSPDGTRLGFVRTDESDRFASAGDVGIYNVDSGETRYLTAAEEKELDGPRFHWLRADTLFVEYTHHAQQGLYRLSLEDGNTTPVKTWRGDAGGFTFGARGRRAAWIQESVGQPPEVYTGRRPLKAATRISTLNAHLQEVWLPRAESVRWTSTGGTTVQGWLVRPRDRSGSIAPPLLVYVHGGPSAELNNRFSMNRGWGRPIQLFAARGYAVFVPNYRQSDSFGKSFQEVEALDREPVQDILTGIAHLVAEGEADPDQIGIMGNSWGAWLGPLVVAEKPMFQAASFAEGVKANALSSYGRSPGWAARDLAEYHVGTTPYENPERYLELSPAYRGRFTKTTPTLLEYGQNGTTVMGGLELGRALWRHGTPHQVVIYPDAGHGLDKPSLLRESMKRNLDWFERWLPVDSARTRKTR